MTISSEVRKAGPFDGNDVADTFPFTFKVFRDEDLLVVRADPIGAETVLGLGTDYTVTLNADQNASPGGSVVTTAPLAAGHTLVLTSKVGNLQPVDLTNQGGFYPAVINSALDRLTILAQQLRVDVDRSAKLPITREEDADELLADVVLIADNMASVQTVGDNIGDVNTVAGISADVSTVAGISGSVPVVAAIEADVSAVAGVASDIPAVAASASNIDAVAADLSNVDTVAGSISAVNATGSDIAAVNTVAANIANINAAVADLPSLAAKVSKTGDTMTGPLEVPAGASGAQVPRAQEVARLASSQTSFRNKLINAAFLINQRAVSGTVTLAAGAFGHDCWRAGAGGCTYTFSTVGGVTTITITAGTLVQPIEGLSIQSGTYVLTWAGTAPARVNGGAYGASGMTAALPGGTAALVEFSTGTLSLPQLEINQPTVFEWRDAAIELVRCLRYYETGSIVLRLSSNAALTLSLLWRVPKPSAPTFSYRDVAGTLNRVTVEGSNGVVASSAPTIRDGDIEWNSSLSPAGASGNLVRCYWTAQISL